MANYDISGNFYEACDCEVICSCWAEVEPVMGQCTGVFIWDIQEGNVDGLPVEDCRFATISHGRSCDDGDQMLILVHSSSNEQAEKLVGAFCDPQSPWNMVFNFPPGADIGAISYTRADISINGDSNPGGIVTWTIQAGGVNVARVNANYKGIFLNPNSPPAIPANRDNKLVDRIVGQHTERNIEAGVIQLTDTIANNPSGHFGLDLLVDGKDTVTQEPYRFDIDVTSVTAMRGSFRYST
jgi:hypothetical protein